MEYGTDDLPGSSTDRLSRYQDVGTVVSFDSTRLAITVKLIPSKATPYSARPFATVPHSIEHYAGADTTSQTNYILGAKCILGMSKSMKLTPFRFHPPSATVSTINT